MTTPAKRFVSDTALTFLGHRRGMNKARKHLCAVFDDKLTELNDDYQDVIREMKSERQRYAAIERALNTERDPDDQWLN